MNDSERQIMSLLGEAVEYSSSEERAAFLDRVCAGNKERQQRLEALVKAHEQAGNFLQGSPSLSELVATVDEPVSERPGTAIGKYKLLEQIGEGGFGIVFMAEQTEPIRRKVALKILKPGMDSKQVVARFEAERQALAVMDHPNIAQVYDAGTTELGRPYFVMELVKGVPITHYCKDKKLNTRERLELFVQVCQTIQHAHQKGIIHRDIKPSNVIVSSHDGTPVVKVIDFGIAKAMCGQLTEKTLFTGFAQMLGTPLYMSPEQAGMSDLDVDTRSDIYSMGVLLYELLTGTTPFDRDRLKNAIYDEIRKIIREEEPPRPSDRISTQGELTSTVSEQRGSTPRALSRLFRGELDWIVLKALEKDRNRRYETANGLARDVQRYLNDEPVEACRPSVWYRVRKLTRRNKVAFSFILLIFLFVVTLGSGVGWVVRDRAAREETIQHERTAREENLASERETRRQQLTNRVTFVLEEVAKHKQSENWTAAQEANNRAKALLGGSNDYQELKDRIRSQKKEIDFVEKLQLVRLARRVVGTKEALRRQAAQEEATYADLFREFGIDVASDSQYELVRKIRQRSSIVPVVTTALDDWAFLRLLHMRSRSGAARLWRLTIALDTDQWRNDLRRAFFRRDYAKLEELANSADMLEQSPTSLWLLGISLASSQPKRNLAINVLRKALRKYPADFWLNYDTGKLLMNGKTPVDAIPYLHAVCAIRPKEFAPVYLLGLALERAGSTDEAIEVWKLSLHQHPNVHWTHLALARAYAKVGNPEMAVRSSETAIEKKPDAKFNIEFEQPKVAIPWYQKAIRDRLQQFGGKGDINRNVLQHHFCEMLNAASISKTDVLPFLRTVVKQYPREATGHHYLGLALVGSKHTFWFDGSLSVEKATNLEFLREGVQHVELACQLDPKCLTYRYSQALVREWVSQPSDIAVWREIVAVDPTQTEAHIRLAEVCGMAERWQEALAHLRIAQQQQPENPDVLLKLCSLLVDCPDETLRQPEEGLALAKQYRRKPTFIENDRLLALAHFRLGHWRFSDQHMKSLGYEQVSRPSIVGLFPEDDALSLLISRTSTPRSR